MELLVEQLKPARRRNAATKLIGLTRLFQRVMAFIVDILEKRLQPSAIELLYQIDQELGLEARWDLAAPH